MLDYAFMQEILQRLNEVYPDRIYNAHGDAQDDEKIVRHMVYLVEHGMVEAHISKDKRGYNIGRAKITPKGIDFPDYALFSANFKSL